MLRSPLLWLALCLISSGLSAQNATQLYVMDLAILPDSSIQLSNPMYLSADNSQGYNNQPFFIDSLLFFTSQTGDGTTDIYALDLNTRTKYQMTDTPESEYSPTPMPGDTSFTVVRVSADTNQIQQLWEIPYKLDREPTLVMDKVYNVGYHCWVNPRSVLMFIVGTPRHRLNLYDVPKQTYDPIASNIGRCIKTSPRNRPVYVDKILDGKWFIKEYDANRNRRITLAETLPDCEDFEWLPNGVLLMGKESLLYTLQAYEDTDWKPVADLKHWGIKNITRMAYGFGKLAVVTSEPTEVKDE